MTLQEDIRRVLELLSGEQIEALAAAADTQTHPDASLGAVVAGAQPSARNAVSALAKSWTRSDGVNGPGVALALRTGLAARRTADAGRSRPVWTGPCAAGEECLTAGVLHELIVGAQRHILLMSFAAHTLPGVAADLEAGVAAGCEVDVVFESESDSSGAYSSHSQRPFAAVSGIRRWHWPAEQRSEGAVLHAKALIIDGERALIGSANLTHRALSANLEVGVLVRDPAVAAALDAHVLRLMEQGVLIQFDES